MSGPATDNSGWLLGVDGCRGGWLVVRGRLSASLDWQDLAWSLEADGAAFVDGGLVAIDIPIGLSSVGPRACDQLARQRLGPRRSSVFPAPLRQTLEATSYAQACALSQAASGRKLSQQAYNLLGKIRQIDRLLHHNPERIARVHEVHPELAFAQWNGGEPMAQAKKAAAGAAQRLALMEPVFSELVAEIRSAVPRSLLASDDILDAIACLWSARRIALQQALVLGDERDLEGLWMRISA